MFEIERDQKNFESLCLTEALAGNGMFAIAHAVMCLAKEQGNTALHLKWLGNGDAATSMGGLEALGSVLTQQGENIARALNEAAANMGGQ